MRIDEGVFTYPLVLDRCFLTVYLGSPLLHWRYVPADGGCVTVILLLWAQFMDNCGQIWRDVVPYGFRHCCQFDMPVLSGCFSGGQGPDKRFGPGDEPVVGPIPGLPPIETVKPTPPDEIEASHQPAESGPPRVDSGCCWPSEKTEKVTETIEQVLDQLKKEYPGATITVYESGVRHTEINALGSRVATPTFGYTMTPFRPDYTPGDEGSPPPQPDAGPIESMPPDYY